MKKKLLGVVVALVAALSFGVAQAAQLDGLQNNEGPALPAALRVYVNPADLGDALIGGYYNARNALTFISLVNTSEDTGVAVKVRFREGKYSNEVLDFFVCLSAGDRWTAWVYGDGDENIPAMVIPWDDDTPTFPTFGTSEDMKVAASCVTEDMTKEGYFTIIGVTAWADSPGSAKTVGTDDECGATLNLIGADDFTAPESLDVSNVLAGTVQIYDLTTGAASFAYNMTALADFRATPIPNPGLGLDDPPTLANSQDGLDGVNYVLTKASLIALYDIESDFVGQSDVILTFPTKKQTLGSASAQNPFSGDIADDGCEFDDACETVDVTLWDDAENSPEVTRGFSPSTTTELELCNEVNYVVVGSQRTSLLDTDVLQFSINTGGFEMGWVNFDLTGDGRSIGIPDAATPDATANGLPVIGYELGSFVGEYLTHMLPLRYTTEY